MADQMTRFEPLPTDADDAQWHEDAGRHYDAKATAFEHEHPYTAPELNPFANTARAHRRAAEALRARASQPAEDGAEDMRKVLDAAINYINVLEGLAGVAREAWDADRDAKVGKVLNALDGSTGYNHSLDAAREAYRTLSPTVAARLSAPGSEESNR